MRLLLAEDDEASCLILRAQLVEMGFEVAAAGDGQEAWESFLAHKPDLVITDWMMPRMDGPELCRRIRNCSLPGYTYILILTALERQQGYLEGMHAGADDFVTKPCDLMELRVRMRVAERVLALQNRVSKLEGLLPICPKCKRIRTAENRWEAIEPFIMRRSTAQFSHGICPQCYESLMKPQLDELKMRRR